MASVVADDGLGEWGIRIVSQDIIGKTRPISVVYRTFIGRRSESNDSIFVSNKGVRAAIEKIRASGGDGLVEKQMGDVSVKVKPPPTEFNAKRFKYGLYPSKYLPFGEHSAENLFVRHLEGTGTATLISRELLRDLIHPKTRIQSFAKCLYGWHKDYDYVSRPKVVNGMEFTASRSLLVKRRRKRQIKKLGRKVGVPVPIEEAFARAEAAVEEGNRKWSGRRWRPIWRRLRRRLRF